MQTHIAYGIINKKQSKNEQILHTLHHTKIHCRFIFLLNYFVKCRFLFIFASNYGKYLSLIHI